MPPIWGIAMKYIFATLLAVIFLTSPVVFAEDSTKINGPLKVLRLPIHMDWGGYPLLAVTFNHTTHKTVACRVCHHKVPADGDYYAPCTTSGCHNIPGPRERVPHSMFMAYHDPGSNHSCYGCHEREAATHPEFIGCRPCHMSPQARKAAAEKATGSPAAGAIKGKKISMDAGGK